MTAEVDVTTLQAQLANALAERRDALEHYQDALDEAAGAQLDAARRRRDLRAAEEQLGQLRKALDGVVEQNVALARELGRAVAVLDGAGVTPAPGPLGPSFSVERRVEQLVTDVRRGAAQAAAAIERAQRDELALARLVSGRIIMRRPEA